MSNGFNEVRINTTTGQEMQAQDYAQKTSSLGSTFQQGNFIYDAETGLMSDVGHVEINTANINRGSGILDSATTPGGLPTSTIEDDTLVNVNGMTTTAKVAAGMGLLKRNAQGQYYEPGSSSTEVDQSQPQDKPPVQPQDTPQDQEVIEAPLTPQAQTDIDQAYQDMGQDNADNLIQTVVNHMNDPERIASFAKQRGLDPDATQNTVNTIINHMTEQAASYLSKKSGGQSNGKDILDWARQKFNQESIQQVIRLHSLGSMEGYDAILREYKKANK